MDKLQILFFFISGFLISRLLIITGLPERLVARVIERQHLSLSRAVLYLVAISALLSFFIPNSVTVLTLLPVVLLLCETFEDACRRPAGTPTVLGLAVVYGANIGGMGSVTGTPANGVLVTFLEAKQVAGSAAVQFATWLAWGLPLVLVMIVLAWLVLRATLLPWQGGEAVRITLQVPQSSRLHRRWALGLTAWYLASSLILSMAMLAWRQQWLAVLVLSGLFTLLLTLFVFLYPLAVGAGGSRRPLLTIAECYSNMPLRGFLFVGITLAIAVLLYLLALDRVLGRAMAAALPTGMSLLIFFLAVALITSFTTEVLSNTVVQIAMFLVLLPLCQSLGLPPLKTLLLVTLSCTCAFMSPIATGVNGLAFGEVRGMSLWRMLLVGSLMNLAAGLVITLWVIYLVPW